MHVTILVVSAFCSKNWTIKAGHSSTAIKAQKTLLVFPVNIDSLSFRHYRTCSGNPFVTSQVDCETMRQRTVFDLDFAALPLKMRKRGG